MTIGKDFYELSPSPIRPDQVAYTGSNEGAYLPYNKTIASSSSTVTNATGTTQTPLFQTTPLFLYGGVTWSNTGDGHRRLYFPDSMFHGQEAVRLTVLGRVTSNDSLAVLTVGCVPLGRFVSSGFSTTLEVNTSPYVDAQDLVYSAGSIAADLRASMEFFITPSTTPGSYTVTASVLGNYFNADSAERRSTFLFNLATGDLPVYDVTSTGVSTNPIILEPFVYWSSGSGTNLVTIDKTFVEFF